MLLHVPLDAVDHGGDGRAEVEPAHHLVVRGHPRLNDLGNVGSTGWDVGAETLEGDLSQIPRWKVLDSYMKVRYEGKDYHTSLKPTDSQ